MFGFGRFGPMELILILVVALLVFGPKKLPEIGRSIGKAIREFKSHSDKLTEELNFDDTGKANSKPYPKAEVVENKENDTRKDRTKETMKEETTGK
jgi:sec-independent protein translocase protein TatA